MIFELIKALSLTDKKTLDQKVLKTVEEVGELAKAVLPYVNAASTTHRFITREKILEEVADGLLCLYSVAYHCGFSTDEIHDTMKLKSFKWDKLQKGEVGMKYPCPYEIHITVAVPQDIDTKTEFVERFKTACAAVGVKPILLDLHIENSSPMKDLMTSSVHYGTNSTAYEEMQRISNALRQMQFTVVRQKIETVPWHPASPKTEDDPMPVNCYFESHLPIKIAPDKIEELRQRISEVSNARVSRNVFKKHVDTVTIMVTLRKKDCGYERFTTDLQGLLGKLETMGLVPDKQIVEFSIFDTNVSQDATWIKNNQ